MRVGGGVQASEQAAVAAPEPRQPLDGSEENGRDRCDDDALRAAAGIVAGAAIGAGFWLSVGLIALALASPQGHSH